MILFIWDKIFYVMKEKGNEPECYFYSVKQEMCLLHKSIFCNCKRNQKEIEVINKYIDLYNYCSQIFVHTNEGYKYISKEHKNQLKFVI